MRVRIGVKEREGGASRFPPLPVADTSSQQDNEKKQIYARTSTVEKSTGRFNSHHEKQFTIFKIQ
jgi:hypothetical protein